MHIQYIIIINYREKTQVSKVRFISKVKTKHHFMITNEIINIYIKEKLVHPSIRKSLNPVILDNSGPEAAV